jgi:hypothetical protein
VVIDNLHIIGIPVAPDKADAPLIIDANTVLPFSLAFERFQVISRGRGEVTKLGGNIQLPELPLCHPLESSKPPDALPRMKLFRISRPEGLDHIESVIRCSLYVKR